MSLTTITGKLYETYGQLQSGTMLRASQLMLERKDNQKMRDQYFYTSEGVIYFIDKISKDPILAVTNETSNPILKNLGKDLNKVLMQLIKEGDYSVEIQDFEQALSDPDTELISLPKLRLLGTEEEWRYLRIGTAKEEYETLNHEERRLAECVYGKGDDFHRVMEMLNKAKKPETSINILNPDYVLRYAENGPIARASYLFNFFFNSRFLITGRGIFCKGSIRGRKKKQVQDQSISAGLC